MLEIAHTVLKELILIVVAVAAIMVALTFVFGSIYPFYVVISESMTPTLEVDDLLIVSSRVDFDDIKPGDIILFNRPDDYVRLHDMETDTDDPSMITFDNPADHGRVIVHRVVEILEDSPRVLMTQGDANPVPIPGVDFPIVQEEYLGKMVYVLPDVGAVTKIIHPPVSYILIGIIMGVVVIYELHTHPKWRWRLILIALNLRDTLQTRLMIIKYDPKSRKARTIFVRQTLKNYFAVVLMSTGLMNNLLKNAHTIDAVPSRALYMYDNMLLNVAHADKMLDKSENLLDATLIKDIRHLLSRIESVKIESGLGSGYPDYDYIKKQTAYCVDHLDSMGDDAVLK